MVAGLLAVGPLWLFVYAAMSHWTPQSMVVPIAAITVCIVGVIWLYDEIRDLLQTR